jgi:RHH-type proline utilization regulon transcriptional repressor/proline dehydrogenase/delta 1-pyrroline-5-carboxylate dehydrogenase
VRVFGYAIETDAAFLERVADRGVDAARVRLLGGDALALATALGGDPDVAIYAGQPTAAGRVELLPFVHEQAISITAHRFGNPDPAMAALVVR